MACYWSQYSIIYSFTRLLSAKCKNALSSWTYVPDPQLYLSPITIATFHSQIFLSYFSFPSLFTLNLIIWMCILFCLDWHYFSLTFILSRILYFSWIKCGKGFRKGKEKTWKCLHTLTLLNPSECRTNQESIQKYWRS